MSEKREHAKKVYEWSSRQTGEAQEFKAEEYYWTEPCKKAVMRLANTQAILLGIIGLQGTGKSSALTAIDKYLSSVMLDGYYCIRYKWSRDWKQRLIGRYAISDDYYYRLLQALLEEQPERVIRKLGTSPDELRLLLNQRYTLEGSLKVEKDEAKLAENENSLSRIEKELDSLGNAGIIENLLGQKSVQSLQEMLLNRYMNHVAYILVDMPDYVKTDVRAMNKDIDELQNMWNGLMRRGQKVSFVVAIQKEIVMKRSHFFFGKFSMLELKPLTPQQLLEAYRLRWKTDEPFTEDSLPINCNDQQRSISKISKIP